MLKLFVKKKKVVKEEYVYSIELILLFARCYLYKKTPQFCTNEMLTFEYLAFIREAGGRSYRVEGSSFEF